MCVIYKFISSLSHSSSDWQILTLDLPLNLLVSHSYPQDQRFIVDPKRWHAFYCSAFLHRILWIIWLIYDVYWQNPVELHICIHFVRMSFTNIQTNASQMPNRNAFKLHNKWFSVDHHFVEISTVWFVWSASNWTMSSSPCNYIKANSSILNHTWFKCVSNILIY